MGAVGAEADRHARGPERQDRPQLPLPRLGIGAGGNGRSLAPVSASRAISARSAAGHGRRSARGDSRPRPIQSPPPDRCRAPPAPSRLPPAPRPDGSGSGLNRPPPPRRSATRRSRPQVCGACGARLGNQPGVPGAGPSTSAAKRASLSSGSAASGRGAGHVGLAHDAAQADRRAAHGRPDPRNSTCRRPW